MNQEPYENADAPAAGPQEPQGGTASEPKAASTTSPRRGLGGGDGAPLDPRRESTIWTGRTHWQHFVGWLTGGAVVIVLIWVGLGVFNERLGLGGGGVFLSGLIAAVVVGLVVAAVIGVRVLQHRYRLTDQRLFIEKGILSQTIDQTELIRVDDVRVHKSLVDRVLGMGTIEVLSTDASDRSVTITGVKDAEAVAEHIRVHMRSLRSRSLFVENL